MRILGIDPGLATIGLGLIEAKNRTDWIAEEWLTIRTKAGLPLADRLKEIADDLKSFLEEAKPDVVIVERLFFAVNAESGLEVAHARGVILATVAGMGLPIHEPTPLQLKAAISGDGQADKRQMQEMVMRLLKLDQIPSPPDAADALALAMYGALTVSSELVSERSN
jgi:crossover junction endodeoxyribonuclease RuvC